MRFAKLALVARRRHGRALNPRSLFYGFGFPAFVLYTIVLHAWTVFLAFEFGSLVPAIVTGLLPVASWIVWCFQIPDAHAAIRSAFAFSVVLWIVSAVLVMLARRMNR